MADTFVFSSASPRFGLPLLFAGQTQKEVWVNEALARTDALLHCAVEGEASAPPADPVDGENWIVSPDATGVWTGYEGCIACRQGGNWLFATPCDGMRILNRSTGQEFRFLGEWKIPAVPVEPTGGSVVDAEARAALGELIAALRVSGAFPTD
jgi:hypothetical protein